MRTIYMLVCTLFFGIATLFAQPRTERVQLLDAVFDLLEQHAANPAWLEDAAFQEFRDTMYSEYSLTRSDSEFLDLFRQERENLSFTHFNIYPTTPKPKDKDPKKKETKKSPQPVISWKPLNQETAYMKVRVFSSDATLMAQVVGEIGTDRFKNLIIDLRESRRCSPMKQHFEWSFPATIAPSSKGRSMCL